MRYIFFNDNNKINNGKWLLHYCFSELYFVIKDNEFGPEISRSEMFRCFSEYSDVMSHYTLPLNLLKPSGFLTYHQV